MFYFQIQNDNRISINFNFIYNIDLTKLEGKRPNLPQTISIHQFHLLQYQLENRFF